MDTSTTNPDVASELASKLGCDEDFFKRMAENDDDWTYIIKAHTLIEASLSWVKYSWFSPTSSIGFGLFNRIQANP